MYRKFLGMLSLIMILAVAFATFSPVFAQSGKGGGLTKHDRELLADAIINGKPTVTLLIASFSGSNTKVANSIKSMGGSILYREDSMDYLRVVVPTDQAEAFSIIDGIQAVNIDEVIPLDDPAPEAVDDSLLIDPPGVATPNENPYMPTQDTGAAQFVEDHPTWDGRGVVIGILDTGVTLDHPSLLTTSTGERKIIDWVTFTDPFTDDDPTWVNMAAQVTAKNGNFSYGGMTYTAPANGGYRIGTFIEGDSRLGGELGSDVNRDGDSNDTFGVLWNTNSDTVWVDTNQNNNFADDMAMMNYKVHYDVNYFGVDDPATAVAERLPFVVQTDGKNKVVNIGIVSGAHGSHVAGIAAGNNLFGGSADGAAPGAKIVSVRVCLFITGCTSHAMIEGMIYAAKQANVDVINMSIGGLPALNDGNNARAILYNRLIEQSKVQMFFSAGNSYAGMNSVGDPSVATDVVSVGAYVNQDTWYYNYAGALSAKVDGIFPFSSRGPREDGGFKPNIVAPGAAVSSVPMWQNQGCLGYVCDVGYAMFNGTSMAAPQSTGAAALLISAAKQMGVQHKPDQLRQAIYSSTRYLPDYDAYEQGNGLFQVGAAWDLLSQNIKTVEITSIAPVNTVLQAYLATPGYGPGIYEREGWFAGQSGERTITFTRTSGGAKPINYDLIWVGNDGTFSSDPSIALALNAPTGLIVNIAPASGGAHSALLYLDDPATTGYDYELMNTIVVAEEFTVDNNFTVSASGGADRPDTTSMFYYVPAGTPAFKLDVSINSGRMRGLRYHPYGVPYDSSSTTGFCTAPCGFSRTVSNPQPGVWELMMETSRTSTATPATFTATASILGVVIDPSAWIVDPTTVGTLYTQPFNFTNNYGAFTGNAIGTALGSAITARPTIANHEQQLYTVNVQAGSTSLTARIGNTSDAAADLDLFVFRPNLTLAGQSADGDSEEAVTIANPMAGTWYILIDGYSVPSGTTEYDYLDVFANPAFGAVSISDPAALHSNGASWSASASVTASSPPDAGRFLQGFVRVVSGSSVLGSAEVDLKNVSP